MTWLKVIKIGGAVMVEDTSLCFNALNGLPGPYIKWFMDKVGHDGLNKMLVGFDDKTAYAQCIFAYTEGEDKPVQLFVGRTPGKIVPPRGPTTFGWDAIFVSVFVNMVKLGWSLTQKISNQMGMTKRMQRWTRLSRIRSRIDIKRWRNYKSILMQRNNCL